MSINSFKNSAHTISPEIGTRAGINLDDFEKVKSKWSAYSSWAVWTPRQSWQTPKAGMGDTSVLDPVQNQELLATLNPNIVFLGLNAASREVNPQPWGNFHDSNPRAQDYKTRYALQGTPLWGAYMTDLFVGLHETDSAKVGKYIRENPEETNRQVNRLEKELSDIGAENPLIIAFGGKVYEVASKLLGDTYRVEKMTHYSHAVKPDNLRQEAIDISRSHTLH